MSYKDILRKRAKKNQSVSALQTFSPEHIIVSPLITEKTFSVESEQDNDKEKVNKYYFKVHSKANKNDVKQSISFLYKVDVEKVNIVIVPMK
ncbi:50S ribosomal protein L23 [bacterium]|nr:50S ribosomal protein L23 [bacterium]